MGKVKSAVKKRRDYVKDMILAYVPDRTIAVKAAEKFSTTTSAIFNDLKIVRKAMSEDAKELENKKMIELKKIQHVNSLQRAMATSISRDNLNLFVRLSEQYMKLMDFNGKSSPKEAAADSQDKVSSMTDEELMDLIKKSGGKFDAGSVH